MKIPFLVILNFSLLQLFYLFIYLIKITATNIIQCELQIVTIILRKTVFFKLKSLLIHQPSVNFLFLLLQLFIPIALHKIP